MVLFPKPGNLGELAEKLCELAQRARRFGLLHLEDDIPEDLPGNLPTYQSWILCKGMRLVLDGTDPELVRIILTFHFEQLQRQLIYRLHVLRRCILAASDKNVRRSSVEMIERFLFPEHPENPILLEQLPDVLNDMLNGALQHPQINSIATSVQSEVEFEWTTAQYLGLLKLEHSIIIEGVLSLQSGDNPTIVAEKLEAIVGYAIKIKRPEFEIREKEPDSAFVSQVEIDALLDKAVDPRSPFDEMLRELPDSTIKSLFASVEFETFRNAILLAKRSTVLRILRALDAQSGAKLLGGIFRAPQLPHDSVHASQIAVIEAAKPFTSQE
jgi:hypothetical protein